MQQKHLLLQTLDISHDMTQLVYEKKENISYFNSAEIYLRIHAWVNTNDIVVVELKEYSTKMTYHNLLTGWPSIV